MTQKRHKAHKELIVNLVVKFVVWMIGTGFIRKMTKNQTNRKFNNCIYCNAFI